MRWRWSRFWLGHDVWESREVYFDLASKSFSSFQPMRQRDGKMSITTGLKWTSGHEPFISENIVWYFHTGAAKKSWNVTSGTLGASATESIRRKLLHQIVVMFLSCQPTAETRRCLIFSFKNPNQAPLTLRRCALGFGKRRFEEPAIIRWTSRSHSFKCHSFMRTRLSALYLNFGQITPLVIHMNEPCE